MSLVTELQGGIRRTTHDGDDPGWAAVFEVLRGLLDGTEPSQRVAARRQLKKGVYRLEIDGDAPWASVVVKRLSPATAERCRLLAEQWLPALELGDHCARLLGVAADPRGHAVWHIYEDLGVEPLSSHPDPRRVEAAVELVATLHVRAARHAVLPDVRRYGVEFGMPYFIANVGDAVHALEQLAATRVEAPAELAGVPGRLRERLQELLGDAPRRARIFAEAQGPDTLLHGDLWTSNVFVDGTRARLIDWDRVGVGPFSYDLSTLLMRFPPQQRPGIVALYQRTLSAAGWRLPTAAQLAVLLDTAERARYANRVIWPALALVRERAAWGFPELAEVERWFQALDASPYTLS
jgi:hypothetical protein